MVSNIERCDRRLFWVGAGALVLTAGLKAWLVLSDTIPFNADEAVVALMARHISQGERPVFFYGQAYMGSLDAWLVAAGFSVFGRQVWVIRLIQSILYLLTVLTTAWMGRRISGNWRVGILSACLLAVPTINVTLYTTVSLGGYGEALLIGNLILITSLRIAENIESNGMPPGVYWLAWGFLVGLGLWAFGITLVYALPSALFLAWFIWKSKRSGTGRSLGNHPAWMGGLALMGFFIGSIPWWGFAAQNGLHLLVSELSGGAIAGVERISWLSQISQHAVNLSLLGSTAILGLRPPWGIQWLGLPLLPLILFFWIGVLVFTIRQFIDGKFRNAQYGLLAGVVISLTAGYIFTPFGADPSGRYFLPLAVPLSIFAGEMILAWKARIGRLAYGAAGLLLIYNLWGTAQCALKNPPGITTQFDPVTQVDQRWIGDLTAFLKTAGETRGYTNYWVSYPLAFISHEELIFSPRLPYHPDFRYTARDNRYAGYDQTVAVAARVAFITTRNPALDSYLRDRFQIREVTWQEKQIGDYHVYYQLSKRVSPEEIGLGVTTP